MNYSDFGNLEKGTRIPRWWLEQFFNVPYTSKQYDLMCLNLVAVIEKAIKKEQNKIVFVRIVKGAIHILTDEEAAVEAPKRHEQSVKKLNKNIRKTHAINVSNLTNADKFNYQKNIMQFQIDNLRRSRRKTGSILSETSKPPDWRSSK